MLSSQLESDFCAQRVKISPEKYVRLSSLTCSNKSQLGKVDVLYFREDTPLDILYFRNQQDLKR